MIRSSEINKSKDSQILKMLSSNHPIAKWKFKNHKYILLLQCKDYSNISLSPEDFITEYDLIQVKKMSHNQIRKQDSKHFGSSGKIYSF